MQETGLLLDRCHAYNQAMAYIETVRESDAEGRLAELYCNGPPILAPALASHCGALDGG